MLVLQDITFILAIFKKNLLQLIKVRWIIFEETSNVNKNPIPNHASSSGLINALEVEDLMSLKVSLGRVYKMLVKTGYKKDSCEKGLTRKNFYKYHYKEGHTINQCEGFCNEVIQMLSHWTFRLEGEIDREVSMVYERRSVRYNSLQKDYPN